MKEIVLTSSILILVIAAARFLFRGKVKRSLIYGMWLLVALRLLLPVQFGGFKFSVLTPAQPLTQTITEVAREPVSGPSRQEVYQNVERLYIQQGRPVSSPQVQQEIQMQVEQSITAPTLGQIATWVWLTGVAGMALWFGLVNFRLIRLLRRGSEPVEGAEAPIPVLVSEQASSPCLVGLFRPVIYLTPESALPHRISHVLAHELTHYKHKDHVWSFVRCLCLCLYWFHPLVWLAAFLSRRDCELACDEGALKQLGEGQRISYGRTLLEIVSHATARGHLLQTATTMNESKRQLKERVNFIVKKPKVWLTATVCMVLVCGICFGCAVSGAAVTEPETTGPGISVTEPAVSQETTDPTTAPTEPQQETGPMGGILLTEDEVGLANGAIRQMEGLTRQYFMQPEFIDVRAVLVASPRYTSASSAEVDAIQGGRELVETDQYPKKWMKYQKEDVDEHLMRWVGLTSDQMHTSATSETVPLRRRTVYLEEYNCYYLYESGDHVLLDNFRCGYGEVVGDWAYLYGIDKENEKESVLTMVQRDGQWYVYSHLPADMVTVRDSIPLTAEQLQQARDAFYPDVYNENEEGEGTIRSSVLSCFLTSTYGCPEEMHLDRFVFNYPDFMEATDQEKTAAYATGKYSYGDGCRKYEKKQIDQALMTHMGITSDVLYHDELPDVAYLEEYDAYYNFFGYEFSVCSELMGGQIRDNVAYLYFYRSGSRDVRIKVLTIWKAPHTFDCSLICSLLFAIS